MIPSPRLLRLALVLAASGAILVGGLAGAGEPELPAPARQALRAMKRWRWDLRLKPERPEVTPDGWDDRLRAEWEICSLPAADRPSVRALLGSDDRFERELAAQALGLTADPSEAPLLLAALEEEEETLVRCRLVEALTRTGGDGVLPALDALSERTDENRDVIYLANWGRSTLRGGRGVDVASILGDHREARAFRSRGIAYPAVRRREVAPELALASRDGPINLSLLDGEVVVVVFTHGERSIPCTKVIQRLHGQRRKLDELGVRVVVVDPHERERTERWQSKLRLKFAFASDPAGRAQARYGVARQLFIDSEWLPSPAWFVIDRRGRVAWWRIGRKRDDHAWLGLIMPVLEDVAQGIVPEMPGGR